MFDAITGLSSTKEVSIREYISDIAAFSTAEINTTIIYKITNSFNAPVTNQDFTKVNSIVKGLKYIKRVEMLTSLGYSVDFHSYADQTFKLNLEVIDSDLPKIMAHIVKDKYVNKIIKFNSIIDKLVIDNPMNYD